MYRGAKSGATCRSALARRATSCQTTAPAAVERADMSLEFGFSFLIHEQSGRSNCARATTLMRRIVWIAVLGCLAPIWGCASPMFVIQQANPAFVPAAVSRP